MKENNESEISVQEQYLDHNGHELPNPTPMQPPVGYVRHKTIAEQMREMIRMASYEAAAAGAESEEEANDFDVGEDMEPSSPWEHDFEVDPALEAMIALQSKPPRKEGAQAEPVPPLSSPSNLGEVQQPSSVPATK